MTLDYESKYAPLLSDRTKNRFFKTFYDFDAKPDPLAHPNPIQLGGGTPNEGFFPVESIHLNLIDEPFQHLDYEVKGPGTNSFDKNTEAQEHKINDKGTTVHTYRYPLGEDEIAINSGFQYSNSDGFPVLQQFSRDLVTTLHKPAYDDYEVILTNGSGDSLFKVADLVCQEGGSILVEEFTFTPFNTGAENYNTRVVPVKLNIKDGSEPGIDVEYLDDLLTNWSTSQYKDSKKPSALYTIPTGQNPTGLTQSLELRKKVYALAEKHDFIIIEDDPYGYLVYPPYGQPNTYDSPDFTIADYKKSLTPSYLTIDTSGRVIRLDTYSKLFAPGLRLGFVTANPYFRRKIFVHTLLSTRHPSGVSQLLLNNVINQWGGVDGWLKWSSKVAKHYTFRRDIFLKEIYASQAYKQSQLTVVEPDAGMFIIIYINLEDKVPNPKDYKQILLKLKTKYIRHGAGVVFGNMMSADPEFESTPAKSNFIRLTIAAVENNDLLVEGVKRFTAATSEFFEDLNRGDYDDLISK
jgi:aromatic amino acid aminotransferase II